MRNKRSSPQIAAKVGNNLQFCNLFTGGVVVKGGDLLGEFHASGTEFANVSIIT